MVMAAKENGLTKIPEISDIIFFINHKEKRCHIMGLFNEFKKGFVTEHDKEKNYQSLLTGNKSLFPVGFPLGTKYVDDPNEITGNIRIKNTYFEIGVPEYQVWALGFNNSNIESYEEAVQEAGFEDGPALIKYLFNSGLLIFIDDNNLQRSLNELRLVATNNAIGKSMDHPERYEIGIFDGEKIKKVAAVSFPIYAIWSANSSRSIWENCLMIAETERLNVKDLAQALVRDMPVLLGTNSAYLDKM